MFLEPAQAGLVCVDAVSNRRNDSRTQILTAAMIYGRKTLTTLMIHGRGF